MLSVAKHLEEILCGLPLLPLPIVKYLNAETRKSGGAEKRTPKEWKPTQGDASPFSLARGSSSRMTGVVRGGETNSSILAVATGLR